MGNNAAITFNYGEGTNGGLIIEDRAALAKEILADSVREAREGSLSISKVCHMCDFWGERYILIKVSFVQSIHIVLIEIADHDQGIWQNYLHCFFHFLSSNSGI